MSISQRIKQLGKDSLVYGTGGVLAKAISFFLLPVYTRIFTPAEYGTIEMLVIICSLLSVVVVTGMDTTQSFYYFKVKEQGKDEQAKIISAIFYWELSWGLVIVFLATLISPLINYSFFNGNLNWQYFVVAFGWTLFGALMRQSAEVYRLLYRPWSYIMIILGQSVGSATLIIVFVMFLDQGIMGYFMGLATSSLLICLVGWISLRNYVRFNQVNYKLWPKLVRFGAPLLPAGLAMYVMNTADRWFIQHYYDEKTLAFYAVGAKLALLIAFAIETFRKAWWPIAMDAMHSDDGPETFRSIARLYMGIGAAGAVYMAFISPWLVKLMAAPVYAQSYPIVSILAWQSVFYGFYMIGVAGFWKTEKTKYIPFLSIGAALLNILLNIYLVPRYGSVGAALGTSIAFFAWIILATLYSEKLWRIGLPVRLLLLQILIGVSATYWITKNYLDESSLVVNALVGHVVAVVLLLSAFRLNQLKSIFRFQAKL